ncbi:cytochrome ubiquinol oxidase subunit I [Vibrio satsumensis]|uniref:cytochrome ubiquinol oxidase subunit I n=1 Tax=Vibrio satsumensis TaxID=2910245 RepID=UPI003D0AA161
MDYIDLVDNARLEFAFSMTSHHVWVPIYLGAALIAAILETLYVTTGRIDYKTSSMYISKMLLPTFIVIIFLGIATPPFSDDWTVWWSYVKVLDPEDLTGRIPSTLIVVTLIAFITSQAGWKRLPPKIHVIATWILPLMPAIAESSAIAVNGWMHAPHTTSSFDLDTLMYVRDSFSAYFFQPMTALRFAHNFAATYIVGIAAVLSMSCYFLLCNKHAFFVQKTVLIASVSGLLLSLFLAVAGDEQGRAVAETQPMKLAQLEALWETDADPHLVLFAIPDMKEMTNKYEISVPYILGFLLGSDDENPIKGIKQLLEENEQRVRNGMIAYQAMQEYQQDRANQEAEQRLLAHHKDLGFAYLLGKYTDDILSATDADIKSAAKDTMTNVTFLFFSFRIMVGLGILLTGVFAYWSVKSYKNTLHTASPWMVKFSMLALPMALVAYLVGWALSEVGRQPWIIYEVLPTFTGGGNYQNGESAGFPITTLIMITTVLFSSLSLYIAWLIRRGPQLDIK